MKLFKKFGLGVALIAAGSQVNAGVEIGSYGVPVGPWRDKCSDWDFAANPILKAKCAGATGAISSLDTSTCTELQMVDVLNGALICKDKIEMQGGYPVGPWRDHCSNWDKSGTVYSAKCNTVEGATSSFDLKNCKVGDVLTVCRGALMCAPASGCPANMVSPAGPWRDKCSYWVTPADNKSVSAKCGNGPVSTLSLPCPAGQVINACDDKLRCTVGNSCPAKVSAAEYQRLQAAYNTAKSADDAADAAVAALQVTLNTEQGQADTAKAKAVQEAADVSKLEADLKDAQAVVQKISDLYKAIGHAKDIGKGVAEANSAYQTYMNAHPNAQAKLHDLLRTYQAKIKAEKQQAADALGIEKKEEADVKPLTEKMKVLQRTAADAQTALDNAKAALEAVAAQ